MNNRTFVSSKIYTRRSFIAGAAAAAAFPKLAHGQIPGIGQVFLPSQFDSGLFPNSLYGIIQNNGLGAGLCYAMDAGSIFSYSTANLGLWIDENAGNNFFIGTTLSTNAAAPSFNGTPGGLSTNELFLSSSGQLFTQQSTSPSYLTNWHKPGGAFTIISVTKIQNYGTINSHIHFNGAPGLSAGVLLETLGGLGSGKFRLSVFGPFSTTLFAKSTTLIVNSSGLNLNDNNTMTMLGVKLDSSVGPNGGRFMINNTATDFNSSYNSPSTVDGFGQPTLSLNPVGGNAQRIFMAAAWNRCLSNSEYDTLYSAVKSLRYSTLP